MRTVYNQIAGTNVERLTALSDGIFAVAMTLLVLDLHTPMVDTIHGEHDLGVALVALAPRLMVYLLSFLTLGIFWVGHQTQLSFLASTDRDLTWIHLTLLFAVTLLPFSTSLMAAFITLRVALLVYWLNILLFGVTVYGGWRYARAHSLVSDAVTPEICGGIERRIVIAQALYAMGAALSVFSTYCSIGFIVLVQLNYAIAPRWGVLARI